MRDDRGELVAWLDESLVTPDFESVGYRFYAAAVESATRTETRSTGPAPRSGPDDAETGWRQVESVFPASPLWPSAAVSPRTALSTK